MALRVTLGLVVLASVVGLGAIVMPGSAPKELHGTVTGPVIFFQPGNPGAVIELAFEISDAVHGSSSDFVFELTYATALRDPTSDGAATVPLDGHVDGPDGRLALLGPSGWRCSDPADCPPGIYSVWLLWPSDTGPVTVDWQASYRASWDRRVPSGATIDLTAEPMGGAKLDVVAEGTLEAGEEIDVEVGSSGPLPAGVLRVELPTDHPAADGGATEARTDVLVPPPVTLQAGRDVPLPYGTSIAPELPAACATGPCTVPLRLVAPGTTSDVPARGVRYRVVVDYVDGRPLDPVEAIVTAGNP